MKPLKKISTAEHAIWDLMFLRALPKQQIAPGIIKRVEVQGTGEVIKDIKVPCSVYLSFSRYDYEGRFHSHAQRVCIRDVGNKSGKDLPPGLYAVVDTMRVDEKCWVNFKTPDMHHVQDLPNGGCHFYITLEEIKYKNSDTMEAKRTVSQAWREQAKKYFMAKDYERALKLYRKEINITQGIQLKKYTREELAEMGQINEKAKRNMLRCFAKITVFDQALSQLADKSSKQLLKKYNDDFTILLRCHVLKQTKYLTTALEMAEQLAKKGCQDAVPLIEELKQLIKNKK